MRTERPRVLRIRATDAGEDAVWTVRLSPEPPAAERGADGDGDGDAECEIAGPAAGLYLSLWNRTAFPSVSGDTALARLWRERSAV